MNKEFLEQFIFRMEELNKASDKDATVRDRIGQYDKVAYMNNAILETKELIKHGESRIALENMLENLNEVGIVLDTDTIDLARKAFGENISAYNEDLLKSMCDQTDQQGISGGAKDVSIY